MRLSCASIACGVLLFAGPANAAITTSGDCGAIASPPSGDFSCTGDVTVDGGSTLTLASRVYSIKGNVTVSGAKLALTGDMTLDVQSASGDGGASSGGGELAIASNGSITVAPATKAIVVRAAKASIEVGSVIDASYTGLEAGPGAGAGCLHSASGGGHGGVGGAGSKPGGITYGTANAPDTLGSGGGSGGSFQGCYPTTAGPGGGAIKLQIAGSLLLDGQITANGRYGGAAGCNSITNACDYFGGGGSGGSIWIEAAQLAGAGAISASGGSGPSDGFGGHGGGGGGGRIAVYAGATSFTGQVHADGLGGGQPGTIVQVVACDPNPCQNGGTCVAVSATTHACSCTPQFGGADCASDVDECAAGGNACGMHAMCTNTDGGFTCACESGYEGDGGTCTAPASPSGSADASDSANPTGSSGVGSGGPSESSNAANDGGAPGTSGSGCAAAPSRAATGGAFVFAALVGALIRRRRRS